MYSMAFIYTKIKGKVDHRYKNILHSRFSFLKVIFMMAHREDKTGMPTGKKSGM